MIRDPVGHGELKLKKARQDRTCLWEHLVRAVTLSLSPTFQWLQTVMFSNPNKKVGNKNSPTRKS
jgi:hypothetical protein